MQTLRFESQLCSLETGNEVISLYPTTLMRLHVMVRVGQCAVNCHGIIEGKILYSRLQPPAELSLFPPKRVYSSAERMPSTIQNTALVISVAAMNAFLSSSGANPP